MIENKKINVSTNNEDIFSVNINGDTFKYPFVWLRDNCQCDQCFHTTAKSRILEWRKFNLKVHPTCIQEGDSLVKIDWNDGHSSQYTHDWLKFRSFLPEDQKRYTEKYYRPKKILWSSAEFDDIFKKYDFDDMMKSDKTLYDSLFNLSTYGVIVIENLPESDSAVDIIINKIGFFKRTHYGKKYVVQQVTNTSNVAYLSSNLQMHTDLPYYENCPGVNVLHCRVQTSSNGGDNLLSDGFFVANYMKQYHPEEYKLLTEIDVEWSDVGVEDGKEFYKLYRLPVISLNSNGEVIRTNLSVPQRGSHFIGDLDDVKPWYEAYGVFIDLAYKFSAKFRTNSGKMLLFDNCRLLHGRNAYQDNQNNVRKLIGAYVDWDEIYSKLRCLNLRLNNINVSN